jgi:hypothetical protein
LNHTLASARLKTTLDDVPLSSLLGEALADLIPDDDDEEDLEEGLEVLDVAGLIGAWNKKK